MIISKTYIDNLCLTPDGEYGTWISCIFTIKNNRSALYYKSDYDEINKIIKELYNYIREYEKEFMKNDKVDKK